MDRRQGRRGKEKKRKREEEKGEEEIKEKKGGHRLKAPISVYMYEKMCIFRTTKLSQRDQPARSVGSVRNPFPDHVDLNCSGMACSTCGCVHRKGTIRKCNRKSITMQTLTKPLTTSGTFTLTEEDLAVMISAFNESLLKKICATSVFSTFTVGTLPNDCAVEKLVVDERERKKTNHMRVNRRIKF